MKERDMFGKSVEVLHNENRKSSGYICLESSKNFIRITEAVAQMCFVEKVFLEILQNFLEHIFI